MQSNRCMQGSGVRRVMHSTASWRNVLLQERFFVQCRHQEVRGEAKHNCLEILFTLLIFQMANECSEYGVCSQGCSNTNQGHQCTCAKGFQLQRDERTCVATGNDSVLVYSTQKKVKTINLNTDYSQLVQKTRQAIGVSFDGNSFYWTEISEGKESLVKYSPSSRKKEVLLTAGLESPENLAVDWLTGNIYFTDAGRAHIAICTNTGLYCTQLVNMNQMQHPRGIVLHPTESLMFWSDWGLEAHIGVAFMDGTGPKILINDVSWPNGLALDWPNARIYWVDAKLQTIESATITGSDRRKVIDDIVKHPFGLAVFQDRIYWSDWETLSIESCDKFTGKNHRTLVQGEQIFGKL